MSMTFRQVVAGDAELECAWIAGDTSGEDVLVFLHEGLGSIAMWREFPERLCASLGCHGLVYSRQGYGQSSRLAGPRGVDFMHREASDVLPAVLAAYGVRRPLLFGHSDGGSIALIYSALFPDTPRAVIALAPHIFVEPMALAEIRAARRAYEEGDLKRRLARFHAHVDDAFYGWNDIWLDPAFEAWDLRGLLGAIRCPVLAIQGYQDAYGTMAQVDGIKARVARAELVKLADCGHAPHRDQPEATSAAVAALVGSLS